MSLITTTTGKYHQAWCLTHSGGETGVIMQNSVAYEEHLDPRHFSGKWGELRSAAEGLRFSTNICGKAMGFFLCLNFK